MSKFYEFQGKNVEKALETASLQLNIPLEKIKHEVLTYGSSGIFGLVGMKKAKIKVFVDEKSAPKKITVPPPEPNNLVEDAASGPEDTTDRILEDLSDDEELLTFGKQALKTIVDGISDNAAVTAEQSREKLLFSVTGGDSAVLIGKRGQTLEAIQYLMEKMINKKTDKKLRVMVDVEGYLEKRKNNLIQLASRMAEKAKKIQKPVTIGQMNAHDRRIVHIHLKDENEIRTQSIGDGHYRKLMIFPKKRGASKAPGKGSKT